MGKAHEKINQMVASHWSVFFNWFELQWSVSSIYFSIVSYIYCQEFFTLTKDGIYKLFAKRIAEEDKEEVSYFLVEAVLRELADTGTGNLTGTCNITALDYVGGEKNKVRRYVKQCKPFTALTQHSLNQHSLNHSISTHSLNHFLTQHSLSTHPLTPHSLTQHSLTHSLAHSLTH